MIRCAATAGSLTVGVALLVSACGSGDEDAGAGRKTTPAVKADAALRVEAAEGPGGTELVAYVEDGAANTPAIAGGKRKVTLRCFDKARRVLVSKPHPWPFTDTDNGLVQAHVHQPVPRTKASQVSRCELDGTRGPLSGELTGSGFR